jgi:predicted transcriptional regulator
MLSAQIGDPENAQRVTVNLSRELGEELRSIARRCNVSESSVVEIALRQLLRRVNPAALASFLREHGGCLRRRRF